MFWREKFQPAQPPSFRRPGLRISALTAFNWTESTAPGATRGCGLHFQPDKGHLEQRLAPPRACKRRFASQVRAACPGFKPSPSAAGAHGSLRFNPPQLGKSTACRAAAAEASARASRLRGSGGDHRAARPGFTWVTQRGPLQPVPPLPGAWWGSRSPSLLRVGRTVMPPAAGMPGDACIQAGFCHRAVGRRKKSMYVGCTYSRCGSWFRWRECSSGSAST